MTYTNATNATNAIDDARCCDGSIKTQPMRDLMDETNEMAHAILLAACQINGFLFYDDSDDTEKACSPSCFRDVLVDTRNELKYALAKLDSIKSMLG